ncbi:MAG: STAS/SEC14 domain-containing protein [Arthrobacter sp.]|nr:STAS/SEC14 domain-containing protein [Arthrobacter sp.]MDZ4354201.1 STAS/SEC14 domain-containing protein [Arthrobacter sp.]
MMPVEAVAAEGKNSLSVRAGIIESVWRPGSFVDVDDAKDAMLAVARISGGTPMPMLSEMTDVEISAAARYEFAQTTGVLAIAVLGSSAVDRVVAAAMSRHTLYPHEFFTSRNAAMTWLADVVKGRAEALPVRSGPGGLPTPVN